MPARISLIVDPTDAEKHVGPGARQAASPPGAVTATLEQLAAKLPPTSTLHLAQDASGEHVAAVGDSARVYPYGERFLLRADGAIARADATEPVYHREVRELILANPVSIEMVRQITESALDAFWARVADLAPEISGDMAPGEVDPLEHIALQTVALWFTNNHPQFDWENNWDAVVALQKAASDPRAI